MTGRWKGFCLCAGVSFLLTLGILLCLGPVWIHDIEDHVLAVLGSIFVLMFVMALLAGAPAADAAGAAISATVDIAAQAAATAVEAGAHGATLMHRLARGAWPAVWGVTIGALVALMTMWALAHSPPLRLVYARARPARALAIDFVRVAQFLEDHKKAHGRPPADAGALGRAMETARVELRFSILRDGQWRDPWDRPFAYFARRSLLGWKVEAYSLGLDGQDNGGQPDDISIRETLKHWKFSRVIGDALEKFMDDKK